MSRDQFVGQPSCRPTRGAFQSRLRESRQWSIARERVAFGNELCSSTRPFRADRRNKRRRPRRPHPCASIVLGDQHVTTEPPRSKGPCDTDRGASTSCKLSAPCGSAIVRALACDRSCQQLRSRYRLGTSIRRAPAGIGRLSSLAAFHGPPSRSGCRGRATAPRRTRRFRPRSME